VNNKIPRHPGAAGFFPQHFLSRDDEVMLAQRIEEGEAQIVEEALSSLLALRWTLNLGKKVAAGQVNVRDIVKIFPEVSGEILIDERILNTRLKSMNAQRVGWRSRWLMAGRSSAENSSSREKDSRPLSSPCNLTPSI
jgi:hypothetical protein